MSGAEHIDIASAKSRGLNESENAIDVNVEEPLPRENDPACTNSDSREESKHSGGLNYGDVEKCFGEGKEAGRLGNEVQTSMEIGASNYICVQQCDGLTSTNVVAEHNGTVMSNLGNVETMGLCSSPKEVHMDVSGSCYEALQCHKAVSTCKNELNPVENSDFIAVEAHTLSLDSIGQAPTAGFVFGNESETCEHLDVDKTACEEPVKIEMSDPNIVPELVSEGLFTENDNVDSPNELNLHNGSGHIDVECGQNERVERKEEVALRSSIDNQDTESNINHDARKYLVEEVEKTRHGTSTDAKDCLNEQRAPLSEEVMEKQYVVVLATPATYEISKRGRKPGKFTPSVKKRCSLRTSVDRTRGSLSRSRDNIEGSQPNPNLENSKGSTGKRRGRKKKTEIEGKPDEEFERMRKHLRYLLHRIRYAQNLLDAYSSEGWRGQSLEKLRPEKELQRAKADITRSKLKIRDLFQRLDTISAQGKFPESLYDSDGLIDSEDIFCAKCGSKDMSLTNDIILCDGVCERGFHQYCLEPPLRTEDIPPGDEGWLCPACDCRVDCLNVLNDSQGIKLSIKDNWEKIFPEAAASTLGKEHDDIMGLPSDDSDDNDFNPEGSDDDANDDDNDDKSDSNSDSESDSSDFSSASEDLGAIAGNDQNQSLLSDDSEDDDDYDPNAVNVNDGLKRESSSSGFTSASENLDPDADDDGGEILGNFPSELPFSEVGGGMGEIPSVSGRRHVERLDYKKLYDETYGNATSDTSDDEEWADVGTTRKEKRAKKGGSGSSLLGDNSGSVATTPKRRGRKKKLNPSVANDDSSVAQWTPNSKKEGSSSKGSRRPPYNKLGPTVIQRLYESFKENQYPGREMREKLADELGLTPDKVNKWFGHARWTFNHHRDRIEASMSRLKVAHNDTANETQSTATDVDTMGTDKKTWVSRRGRKRKKIEDDEPNVQSSNYEIPIEGSTQEAQQGVEKRLNNVGAL